MRRNESTRWIMRTLTVVVASAAVCSPAFADGHGHAHGHSTFSAGRGSFSGHGGGHGRGGFTSSTPGRTPVGASRSEGRNFESHGGSYSAFRSPGTVQSAPPANSGRFSPGSRPTFSAGGNQFGVRIPDASRPGYAPGAHPRPGFGTTRPDFGVRPGFSTRPDLNGRRDVVTEPRMSVGSSFSGSSFRTRPGAGGISTFKPVPGFNGGRRFDGRDFDRRPGFDHHPGFDGRPGFDHRPGFDRPGFDHRPGFAHHRHWGGGYWNGSFWPRVYYRTGFVSFWPVLPAYYTTYWYSGEPYFYVDDLYYRWDSDRYGYVVTDPPPAEESTAADEDNAEDSDTAGSASVYIYPRNGQSEQQTADDRYECHQWAVSQTGFDPTTTTADAAMANSAADYRRALIACLDARGYSAK